MGKIITRLLTPIEAKLLNILSQGKTEKEAAALLHRSKFTIDKYMRSIFSKYHVHNTTAAVAEALRQKDIE